MSLPSRTLRVHAVIHVSDDLDPAVEAATALKHGASGCFLIDHDQDDARLARAIASVRTNQPGCFLGANVIRRSPLQSLTVLNEFFGGNVPLDALWTDSAGIDLSGPDKEHAAFTDLRSAIGWDGLHFGGVAFKHQTPVGEDDLAPLGRVVSEHVDVPTTSGPGTGQTASVRKLELLRKGVADCPLGLASGVTPQNVHQIVGLVDYVLVSTGISAPGGGIDPQLLEELVDRARADGTAYP